MEDLLLIDEIDFYLLFKDGVLIGLLYSLSVGLIAIGINFAFKFFKSI